MAQTEPYRLIYARVVPKHLALIDARYVRLIRDRIEEQLRFDPNAATKNRKPLRQPTPFGASWEIRLGPSNRFRVLYDIDEENREVQILAIGVKDGNRLLIAGQEIAL